MSTPGLEDDTNRLTIPDNVDGSVREGRLALKNLKHGDFWPSDDLQGEKINFGFVPTTLAGMELSSMLTLCHQIGFSKCIILGTQSATGVDWLRGFTRTGECNMDTSGALRQQLPSQVS